LRRHQGTPVTWCKGTCNAACVAIVCTVVPVGLGLIFALVYFIVRARRARFAREVYLSQPYLQGAVIPPMPVGAPGAYVQPGYTSTPLAGAAQMGYPVQPATTYTAVVSQQPEQPGKSSYLSN
jgi:hypothetical protein